MRSTVTAISLPMASVAPVANDCTGVRLSARDGSVIHARTLEFGIDIQSNVLIVPRGFARTASEPDGKPGMQWTSKYAVVVANGAGVPFIFDGHDEKGLAVGTFYFPGAPQYMQYTAVDAGHSLASWELGSWLLENFASVDEVRADIDKVRVPAVEFAAWKMVPSVHHVVHDASGKSMTLEYLGGKLGVFDNRLGVLANSPGFDWHMTNLRNYVNLSARDVSERQFGPVKVTPTGIGPGLLGRPGGMTPPSRFVRAAAFSQALYPSDIGYAAVLQVFHLLNNFDVPRGIARTVELDAEGNRLADSALWTSANDLKAKRFNFRTFENSQIRMVDLMSIEVGCQGDCVPLDEGRRRGQGLYKLTSREAFLILGIGRSCWCPLA